MEGRGAVGVRTPEGLHITAVWEKSNQDWLFPENGERANEMSERRMEGREEGARERAVATAAAAAAVAVSL